MSIAGFSPRAPLSQNPIQPPHPQAASLPGIGSHDRAFDRFQRQNTLPNIQLSQGQRTQLVALHPKEVLDFKKLQQQYGTPEDSLEALYMYNTIQKTLDPGERKQLKRLLSQGILHNTQTDDHRSTLSHLYAILTTGRATGYDNRTILRETLDILSRPFAITQKFAPLSKSGEKQLLGTQAQNGQNPLAPTDLKVDSSATCVASSVMYYMADREPAELARHINELTSPLNAFFEKARFEEISPDNPADAIKILQENQIPFYISQPGEVIVKVENPPAGVIRAVDSQGMPNDHQYRNGVETAYQSALTHLATRSYDPATDLRDSENPGETSKGLTEAEKTLMESIVKENGGVQSITYQAVANKANPNPGEEGNSYLYGYNRSFEQTTNDILRALEMRQPVIVGTTDTDATGAIVTGHEITITTVYTDPSDQQIKFVVTDSDDNNPLPVVKTARELIPTIHHAGLPLALARQINREISANQNGYLIPDASDATQFKLLHQASGPMPMETETAEVPAPQPPLAAPASLSPMLTQPGRASMYTPNTASPFQIPTTQNPFITSFNNASHSPVIAPIRAGLQAVPGLPTINRFSPPSVNLPQNVPFRPSLPNPGLMPSRQPLPPVRIPQPVSMNLAS